MHGVYNILQTNRQFSHNRLKANPSGLKVDQTSMLPSDYLSVTSMRPIIIMHHVPYKNLQQRK